MTSSYANQSNVAYIEQMFENYQKDPQSVDSSWQRFFEGMAFALEGSGPKPATDPTSGLETRVYELIRAYRKWGHLSAKIDPLNRERPVHNQLDLENFGFTTADLEKQVPTCGFLKKPAAALSELIAALRKTYCSTVGVEYLHGSDLKMEAWFQQRLEPNLNQPDLSLDDKRQILLRLNEAELFEKFLHARYPGQKRFSLEGGEAFIPCMSELIEALGSLEVEDVVVGMSHRGRLNVLANIMGKTYEQMFTEFEPNYQPDTVAGDGDVKYHKGYVSEFRTRSGGIVHISLADNPSHLEAVCPVVQGLVRANQSLRKDKNRRKVVPVLIHGDASFAGQGIVSETLNMYQLEGYRTGGTIHIIINNQIGFTTDPCDSRSTEYCSDVARQIMAPVFHVNGNDPEAIVHVVRLAAAFRQAFRGDVVIDINCYRFHGHNESDEASFTQPLMYRTIRNMDSVRQTYVAQLIGRSELEAGVARELEQEFREKLEEALTEARSGRVPLAKPTAGDHFSDFRITNDTDLFAKVETHITQELLLETARGVTRIPQGFKAHAKARKLMQQRLDAVENGTALDWGTVEMLTYGSLLLENVPCRLSGQDVRRGTFSHRHAALWDMNTGKITIPANQMREDQAKFSLFNSHLSELAVLGFEFGYSLARPNSLVIWEAQFGDFSNGAQIIIDQFISSSESKWNRVSNLVMYLPHGYEGQGPEHSSARLERYLQLCANNNMQVANLTQPAQLFHILRRQAKRDFRKPLIIMTPKSLLRHPDCVSTIQDLTDGGFHEIISGPGQELETARRLILCSGKIYYELAQKKEGNNPVSIARIEQLYPLATHQLEAIHQRMPLLEEVYWVQEEPQNMGAWSFMEPRLRALFGKQVHYAGRAASASPAVGSLAHHRVEQERILEQALSWGENR